MTKETVRYPDGVVAAVEGAVGEGIFESKSEFYRFSAEYVLRALDPDYEPETYDFEEILAELQEAGGLSRADREGATDAFLETVAAVRRHCFRGEYEEAARRIDVAYDPAEPEAILLEEFLAQYKVAAATGLSSQGWASPGNE